MSRHTVLAFDFGASSGRAIKAVYEDGKINYTEVHRFENTPIERVGTLYWDIDDLFAQIHIGIEKAGSVDSIAFDTWGVDFGLLGADGNLLESPVHYRDTRTNGMVEKVLAGVGEDELYQKTGNQIMDINTLFQLAALKEHRPELLAQAKTLLFMPDLFAYHLTKQPSCEISIASTSQMLNPQDAGWSYELLDSLGLPHNILLPPVPSGTVTGMLGKAKIIAVAGHDTQCAVAAMPTTEKNVAFLSCGTWSLLGTELNEPILTAQSRALELSNEIGANGKINYLKNIIGLWLIQESRREWRRQGKEYSYADLEREALSSPPLTCFIDPDSKEFGVPGDIPALVQSYCAKTGQRVPQTVGEIMRCIYESLALKYRFAIEQLQNITATPFASLHILGGGTKDKLLCQMTANSCRLPVIAGPIEATALGNIIIQLVALGALPNIDAGRALIRDSEAMLHYAPTEQDAWNDAFDKYQKIIK